MTQQARKWVQRHGNTESDAFDLTQDTLIKVCVKRHDLTGEKLRAYYMAAVKNNLKYMHRGARTRSSCEAEVSYHESLRKLELPVNDVLDVRRALCQLDEEERRLLDLRYGQDLSYEVIAPLLHISYGAARKRVERAIAKLRELLT